MASRSTILRRLDFLKLGIGAAPLTRAARAGFALAGLTLLFALSACDLTSQDPGLAPGNTVLQSDVASEYLTVAEVLPKLKAVPQRPEMPADIARQQVSVNTRIELFVKSDGTVHGELTRIAETSGYPELDEIALNWAKKMEFHPATTKEGKPVAVRMRIPIMWKSK